VSKNPKKFEFGIILECEKEDIACMHFLRSYFEGH